MTATACGSPTVVQTVQYEGTSDRRASLAATIDGVPDYLLSYQYDTAGRLVEIHQTAQSGGNAVADVEVTFGYDYAGRLAQIDRYQGAQLVATSTYAYDFYGRLASLDHSQGETQLAYYELAYSDTLCWRALSLIGLSRGGGLLTAGDVQWLPSPGVDTSGVVQALINQVQSGGSLLASVTSLEGLANYSYDVTGQLLSATYSGATGLPAILGGWFI